jgi:hypothetical protein
VTALGICLSLAAFSGPAVWVPGERFTLAWTHSIEKTRWEEDYTVQWYDTPAKAVLIATEARIRGSGAGMEPPPEAVLQGGWWRYTPAVRQPSELPLTRSGFTPDFERCDAQGGLSGERPAGAQTCGVRLRRNPQGGRAKGVDGHQTAQRCAGYGRSDHPNHG